MGGFIKLILMIIHFQVIVSTNEVSKNTILETSDGINLHDRMSRIEVENQQQKYEISFLKGVVVEDKRVIRQLTGRVSRLESLLMITESSAFSENLLKRPKRPYRLLPVNHKEGSKQIDKEIAYDETHFYGPATNCNELGKLGYTLNGYYLVKGSDDSHIHPSIEAVFCHFQLPPNFKTSTSEERLGYVSTTLNKAAKYQGDNIMNLLRSSITSSVPITPTAVMNGQREEKTTRLQKEEQITELETPRARRRPVPTTQQPVMNEENGIIKLQTNWGKSTTKRKRVSLKTLFTVTPTAKTTVMADEEKEQNTEPKTTLSTSEQENEHTKGCFPAGSRICDTFVNFFQKPSLSSLGNIFRGRRHSFDYERISHTLKNKHGKCLAMSTSNGTLNTAGNGAKIIQLICDPRQNGQLWRFIGDQLCNGWNKCISLQNKSNPDGISSGSIHRADPDINSWQQKWRFENPGRIFDSRGNCLDVESDFDGAEVKVDKCNNKHKGQWWSFDF